MTCVARNLPKDNTGLQEMCAITYSRSCSTVLKQWQHRIVNGITDDRDNMGQIC